MTRNKDETGSYIAEGFLEKIQTTFKKLFSTVKKSRNLIFFEFKLRLFENESVSMFCLEATNYKSKHS